MVLVLYIVTTGFVLSVSLYILWVGYQDFKRQLNSEEEEDVPPERQVW